MVDARQPENEVDRLNALRVSGVLDTPSESSFDGLIYLAADLCDAPTAFVNKADVDLQQLPSKYSMAAEVITDDVPPACDLASARKRLGVDDLFLKEIAGLFLELIPERLDELEAAMKDRNLSDASEIVHAIKGSLMNFSARPSFEIAYQLESECRNGSTDSIDKSYADLLIEIERLSDSLRRELFANGREHLIASPQTR